jgi:tetratricopeptide (TPR) repeat protein
VSQGKKVSRQTLIGERGIALIHTRVTEMGFLFHPRRVDHGIDGHIDLVDPSSGEVLNLVLLVQSKASTLPFTAETETSFRYTCHERDLNYWLRGNAPVILVLSHPEQDEAWWVDVRAEFADPRRRAARIVTVDKRRQVFDASAASELLRRAAPRNAELEVEVRPGLPVSEALDPFVFEVHEAISPAGVAPLASRLPVYIRRQHDGDLEKVVDRAVAGESGLAVLLGNSSTGKTRSAWEQVQRLPEPWRLWRPMSPNELLATLPAIGPHTVLWLNELHRYLHTDDVRRDETIASWLLETLRDPDRAPVLVLGTLWHEYRLRLAPAEIDNDVRPQVRTLVSGHFIPVLETFTENELRLLASAAKQDPRLVEARARAEEGHVTQYLAGGPAQIERYLTADPAAQAILHAAMDARRLGWGLSLPTAFLVDAAQAYMTELQRDNLPSDWFDRAVSRYLLPLCRGARGPLSRVRLESSATASETDYRLADYLEQYGKRIRSELRPPDAFWLAALRDEVAGRDQASLARAAYVRDRTDIAHQLARAAAASGDTSGVASFAALIEQNEDREAALPYFRLAAENGHAWSQVVIGTWHEDKGEWETAKTWYSLADDGENPQALVGLASIQSRLGQAERAEQLYEQALAVGGARTVEYQARHLAEQGEHDLALQLASRSFEHGNYEALTGLAWTYVSTDKSRAFTVMEHATRLGFQDAIAELIILSTTVKNPELTLAYCDIAEQSRHPNTLRVAGTILLRKGHERRGAALLWRAFNAGLHWALFPLGELREKQGRTRGARKIYRSLAKVGQSYALVKLAALYERIGDSAAAERLAERYERVSPPAPNNSGWYEVAEARQQRGDIIGAESILWRLVEQGDSQALVRIAESRIKVGNQSEVKDILRRAINSGAPAAKKLLAKLDLTPPD